MRPVVRGTARPDLRRHVAACMGCEHWQVDVRAGAISDLGGWIEAFQAIALAHHEHLTSECVNPDGRVLFNGEWVERMNLSDGKPATGMLAIQPLPRWWVTQ